MREPHYASMDRRAAGWEHFADADWAAARDAFAAALERTPATRRRSTGWGRRCGGSASATRGSSAGARPTRPTARAATRAGRRAARRRTSRASTASTAATPRPRAGWRARGGCSPTRRRAPSTAGSAIEEAKRADDPAEAERHAREALAIAHELADPDIECMALAQLGRAVVRQGRVDEGMALLDEAMTVALGGETSDPLACGDACCTTLVVCDGLADLDARDAVVRGGRRVHRAAPVHARAVVVPRRSSARVLVRAGDWERAEAVLTEALARPAEPARGRRPRAAARGARRPAAASRAARRRRGGCSRGSTTSPVALAPLVRLHSRAASSSSPRRCSTRRGRRGARAARRGRAGARRPRPPARADAPARARGGSREDLARRGGAAGGRRAAAATPGDGGSRTRSPASPRCGFPYEAARARLDARRARRPPPARRSRSPPRAPRATRSSGSARCRDADRAAALLRELGAAGRTAPRGERDELTARERRSCG